MTEEMTREERKAVKEDMEKFAEWRNEQVEQLDEEFKEEAKELASELRRKGFWMNEDSLYDLHIIHGLELDKIEEDVKSVFEEVKEDG